MGSTNTICTEIKPNRMRLFVIAVLLCLGTSMYASGAKLVTKSQEQQLIKVLKRWNGIYAEGIKAKEEVQKRGGQQQQQQQQQNLHNNNNINIHLHQLQTQVSHYNAYGHYNGYYPVQHPGYQPPSYHRPQYNPSPQAYRYSSSRSSSRRRRSASNEE